MELNNKAAEKLTDEIKFLQVRITELEKSESEHKFADELLRKTELQQKAILNTIPDMAWLKDKESKFIAVNDAFGMVCGFKPEDLVGKTDLDVWPADLAEKYRADDKEVMDSGKRKCVEEPLMKKDILSLVKFVIKNNFSVTMTSNGFLIEEEMAKDIADSGVVSMPISLDSLDPRIHDFLRGQDGAHKNAMKAIEYFLKYQGSMHHITIQTIIMDVNLDGILALTHWAKERNISISFMGIMNPNPGFADERWYESAPYSFLWPKDIAKVHLIVDQLIRLKKEGLRITNSFAQLEAFKLYFENPLRFVRKSICSLGDGIVNVDPKGDVYLCWQMKPIGNIKTHRLKDIWYSEIAKRIRNDIFFCKKNCAEMINCFFED